ncbi:hypothetical protein [Halobaculum sp. MBLA0143]|uniref:hypothetical protein n=1 Tax=Halobaculum sp. MBLA0143 TaxID=3079933 RepID=UPI003524DB9B
MEPSIDSLRILGVSLSLVAICVTFVSKAPNPREEFRLKVEDDLDDKFSERVERLAEKTIEVASYEANDDGEIDVDNGGAVAKVIRGGLDRSYLDSESLGQGVEKDVAEVQRAVRDLLPTVRWAEQCYEVCCKAYWTTVRLAVLIVVVVLFGVLGIAVPVVYDGPLPSWVGPRLSELTTFAGLIGLFVAVLAGVVFLLARDKLKKFLRQAELMEQAEED